MTRVQNVLDLRERDVMIGETDGDADIFHGETGVFTLHQQRQQVRGKGHETAEDVVGVLLAETLTLVYTHKKRRKLNKPLLMKQESVLRKQSSVMLFKKVVLLK